MKLQSRKIILSIIAVGVAIAVILLIKANKDVANLPQGNSSSQQQASQQLYSEQAITHGHGLAVDVADSNKLYIATHHGLLVLVNEKDLYRVGKSRDDYMGFSVHPTNPNIFFSSGHPSYGGNIGFQRSDDGGVKWKKISNGANGPVDFHALTVSPVNPNLVYGWFQGNLQRSNDGGMTWEVYPTDFPVSSLVADPEDEQIVYAVTPRGVLVSKDKGYHWTDNLTGGLKESNVFAFAVRSGDARQMLTSSQEFGLEKSVDGGTTWKKIPEGFNGETVLQIAFSRSMSHIVYALTHENALYKSMDGGDSWVKVR